MFTLAALSLAACSNDDDDIASNGQQQLLPLAITVTENPLLNPDAPSQVQSTRAAVTTTSSLNEFTLDYQYVRGNELMHGYIKATKDGSGNWSAGNWPDAGGDTEVNWYAHTDGTIPYQANYLSFTVEELSTQQKDLLVATAAGTKNTTVGNLSFTFDHACTALRFYVKKAKNLEDYTLKVSEIKICNIVRDGKYYFSTAAWTPGATRSQYTLYAGSGKTLGTEEYTLLNANEDDFLFMIPQTLTAGAPPSAPANTYLELTCTISKKNGSNVFNGPAYIPFAATLAKGTQYDVKINIGKNSLYNSSGNTIITE